jgi:Domain of unknown function (DUF4136)
VSRTLVIISFLFLVLVPVLVRAEVRVDFDRHKDFSRYRTVSVEVGELVRADGSVDEQNTLDENRLRAAVTNELLARGIESSDMDTHLIVRISGRETERTEILSSGWNTYPSYWYWRRGYWRRPYGFWASPGRWGYPYHGDVWSRRYLEGSLLIDVIERETGALVYRAQVTQEVGKDRDKQIAKAVDKAFKKFPVKERTG